MRANKGIKDSNPLLKKSYLSRQHILSSKKLFAEDAGGGAFAQGKFVISAGYGFPNLGKAVIQAVIDASHNPTNVKATSIGPLHFRAEYALSDGVGLAASINYISAGVKWTSMNDTTLMLYDNSLSRSSLSVLARLNFHFAVSEHVDPYFGIGAGYKGVTWSIKSADPNVNNYSIKPFSPFGFETTIGVRFYITEGFGFYTEIGLAKSLMQVGLVGSF
jgi:opacity protein-like surface antigen